MNLSKNFTGICQKLFLSSGATSPYTSEVFIRLYVVALRIKSSEVKFYPIYEFKATITLNVMKLRSVP